MSRVTELYEKYFIEYASYVIRDRAIPDIQDGFKPVQRRILHTLFEMDDGRFHKVNTVVGAAMKYHPHGDASINDALVNLANCELFIEGQGNYGNMLTGEGAAAGRYIECRLYPLAKKVLYSPEITKYVDTYDGRNKEPVVFPAKLPVSIIQGVSGIAVGMRTDIMPHNVLEVIDAMVKALKGEDFVLYPDFPTGGIVNVGEYDDGKGQVIVRARLDTSDDKKVVITELPYGVTSDQMIESIEDANKKGKLHIASINDFTAKNANIEINLQRNTYTKDIVEALYAFTKCENKISCNPLVIENNYPRIISVTEQVKYQAEQLVKILLAELEVQRGHLVDKLHARTLERIFIEERIYKRIENKKTAEAVNKAVLTGFDPFKDELVREISDDDIERLLKIPIRRISLFDIEKNREDIEDLNKQIEQVDYNSSHIIEHAVSYLHEVRDMIPPERGKRKSEISEFTKSNNRDNSVKNLELRYDETTGYLGTNLKTGEVLMKVSPFDKFFYMRKDGFYRVTNVSDKEYIGTGGIFNCSIIDKEKPLSNTVYTAIFKEKESKIYFIKRFVISSYTVGKLYPILPKGNFKLVKLSTYPAAEIIAKFKPGLGYRYLEQTFRFADFKVLKSSTGQGQKLTVKQLQSLTLRQIKDFSTTAESEPGLFDGITDDNK